MKLRCDLVVNVFVLARGRLYQLTEGGMGSWGARTGPHGKGALPIGGYEILPVKSIDPLAPENAAFKDPEGNAWFAPLAPKFKTDRTGLGIHPDGNVPGTLGCVGITKNNTSDLRDLLKNGGVLYVVDTKE